MRLIEEEKERARLEVLEAKRQEAANILKMKQDKFKAHKSLLLARLSGSTWVEKDGENKYYDAVDWKDAVLSARDKVKDVLGEEEEGANESKDENKDEMKIESVQAEHPTGTVISDGPEPKRPTSEWIEVEVKGQKMLQNIITQEFKPV